MENKTEKKPLKKIILAAIVILAAAAAVCGGTLLIKNDKKENKTEDIANAYVKAYIEDDIDMQYSLLDASYMLGEAKNTVSYESKPLMSTNYSFTSRLVKHADEATLKKINNVYAARTSYGDSKEVTVDEAHRYNIKLKNKSTGKDVFRVNLWLVKIEGDWKICTVYEYDRSIDRCAAADMY